jgi:hypothetical protein
VLLAGVAQATRGVQAEGPGPLVTSAPRFENLGYPVGMARQYASVPVIVCSIGIPGLVVPVPEHLKLGEVIKIDMRAGECLSRA